MKININQRCKVVLTKHGAAHYNKHMEQYRQFYCKQAGEVLVGPLWETMQIFGEAIYMGMPESPFLGNELEVMDFESVE